MNAQQMTAIGFDEPGSSAVLRPETLPIPEPGPNQLLIKVAAAGINRPDIAQRQGVYPPPPGASPILGLEIAGDVVALGQNAQDFRLGDKVLALVSGGGYAQYCVVDEKNALPIPQGYDYIKAAAIPETFFTVWSNVFDRGQLKPGETLLIHGGSSGIGTVAIQLAKACGAQVIITAGSQQKCQACLELGADFAINYRQDDFVAKVKEFTQDKGADVVLDMVGGSYTNRNLSAAAIEGRVVQIAFLENHQVTINLNTLMRKRLVLTGSMLRARDVAFKAAIAQQLKHIVWPWLETGQVAPVIDKVFALDEVKSAHDYIEAGDHIGKVVLKII